jgi:ABC-type multidrug transport system fused ATPase/permease subunit
LQAVHNHAVICSPCLAFSLDVPVNQPFLSSHAGAFGERGLQVLQNLVLSLWSNHTSSVQQQQKAAAAAAAAGQAPDSSPPPGSFRTGFYLTLYFALGLGSVGVVLLRSALLVVGSIAASRRLHRQLLHKLLRLPMSFFDAQPSGEC